jgi:pantothenate synthetase
LLLLLCQYVLHNYVHVQCSVTVDVLFLPVMMQALISTNMTTPTTIVLVLEGSEKKTCFIATLTGVDQVFNIVQHSKCPTTLAVLLTYQYIRL